MSSVAQLKISAPAKPVVDFQAHAESDAILMRRSGRAMGAIAGLIGENLSRLDIEDDSDFLTPSALSGLLDAVQLLADQLAERGEDLGEIIAAGSV